MILFAGLGNPGAEHECNRHNIGMMAVDAIAGAYDFSPEKSRFSGRVREGRLADEKILILKPMTFMNESGRAVGEAARFFKIPPEDIVVFHDEIDLTSGKLRMKSGGGMAGHNGLKSIAAHISNNFRRARLGIGHPGDADRVTSHVLGNFSKADQDWLTPFLDALTRHAALLAGGTDASYQNEVHHDLNPPSNSP